MARKNAADKLEARRRLDEFHRIACRSETAPRGRTGAPHLVPSLAGGINLPDPADRHVVAAAIEAKASHILTWNLRDFPAKELRKNRLIRETPDGFLAGSMTKLPTLSLGRWQTLVAISRKSGSSAQDFLELLGRPKDLRS